MANRLRALLVLLLLTACEATPTEAPQQPVVVFQMAAAAPSLAPAETVTITLEGPTSQTITASPGTTVSVKVKFGSYRATLVGFAGGLVVWRVETSFSVSGPETRVTLPALTPYFPLAVRGAGTGSGSVASNPTGISCTITSGNTSGTCTAAFATGTSVTLTGTAGSGFNFGGWSGDCSGTGTCQASLSQARTITASFAAPAAQCAITVSAGTGGTAALTDGGASGACGRSVTVQATPGSGYSFTRWESGGSTVSAANPYAFTLSDTRTVTAVFTPTPADCAITVGAGNGGTAALTSGGATGACGRSVTVAATPVGGFTFTRWEVSGAPVSTANPYSFTLSDNRTITAVFTEIPTSCAITVSAGTGGTAALTSGGASGTCGRSVTVQATPNGGYSFTRWEVSGSQVSTSNPYAFVLNSNLTVTAVFTQTPASCAITVGAGTGGTAALTAGGASGTCGRSVTVTATPSSGYTFTRWEVGGMQVSTSNPYAFTLTNDMTVSAVFTQTAATCAVTASAGTGGTAAVTSGGTSGSCGRSVTLTATPNTSYAFTRWEVGGMQVSTSNPYTFTLQDTRTVTAVFTVTSCNVMAAAGTGGTASVTAGATGGCGRFVTVTATPSSGYVFSRWEVNGSQVSTSNPYTFSISTDVTLTAIFSPICTVATDASPGVGGTASVTNGGLSGACGRSVTVQASAGNNYAFARWEVNGMQVSTANPYTFNLPDSRIMTAVFTPTCSVSAAVYFTNQGSASVTGGGTVGACGRSVTVTATPASGYVFSLWEVGFNTVSTTNPYTFTLNDNRTLFAEFTQVCTVTVNAGTGGTASLTSGVASGACGRSVTVTATPNSGYTFTRWEVNGAQLSVANPYTFSLTGNLTLSATFTQNE